MIVVSGIIQEVNKETEEHAPCVDAHNIVLLDGQPARNSKNLVMISNEKRITIFSDDGKYDSLSGSMTLREHSDFPIRYFVIAVNVVYCIREIDIIIIDRHNYNYKIFDVNDVIVSVRFIAGSLTVYLMDRPDIVLSDDLSGEKEAVDGL